MKLQKVVDNDDFESTSSINIYSSSETDKTGRAKAIRQKHCDIICTTVVVFLVSNPDMKLSHVFEGVINNFRLFSHPYITKRLLFQAENACPYNPTTYANIFF